MKNQSSSKGVRRIAGVPSTQIATAIAAVSFLVSTGPAGAQNATPATAVTAQEGHSPGIDLQEQIVVPTGSSVVVTLPGNATRVAISDEATASARVLSMTELLITGAAFGQTTLYVWLEDGQRLLYPLVVGRDLQLLSEVLAEIDPSITATEAPSGDLVLLKGKVPTSDLADEAMRRAQQFLTQVAGPEGRGPNVVNLIKSQTPATADQRLQQALQSIDSRIRVRRVQVGSEGDTDSDSYILEGRVKNLVMLQRALEIADRQLGGDGGKIEAPQHADFVAGRGNLNLGVGSSSGNTANGGLGGTGALGGMGVGGAGSGAGSRAPSDLATFVSRGLVLKTAGGRVVSFLEVDVLGQILVSIKALEINRTRAKQMGVNYTVTAQDFAIGNYTAPIPVGTAPPPGGGLLGAAAGALGATSGGNLVGAYVGDSVSALAAIDFIETNGIGRTVANPNVLTLSGEQSSIQIGGEVPIPTTTVNATTAVQGFYFQNYGIQLDIRPTLDEKGIITLEAVPSITRPDPGTAVEGVPGFQVQRVSTTARVLDGQSLILGGLISYEETEKERKVPVLGDIPVVRHAFRWEKKERLERELLFVITPKVRDDDPEGVSEEFALPGLESRQQIPLDQQAKPIDMGPEGIPMNWLIVKDELKRGHGNGFGEQSDLENGGGYGSGKEVINGTGSDTRIPPAPPTTGAQGPEGTVGSPGSEGARKSRGGVPIFPYRR